MHFSYRLSFCHVNCNLSSLIKVLLWQPQNIILELGLMIRIALGEEHARIQSQAETFNLALLEELHNGLGTHPVNTDRDSLVYLPNPGHAATSPSHPHE